MNKKVIIIGATSGIGASLAFLMHSSGYAVGITGRRQEKLSEIQGQLGERLYIQQMDVADPESARNALDHLIETMGGMDIIIVNAGIAKIYPDWEFEMSIVDINVRGFVAIASKAMEYFSKQGSGHIVGISSVAAVRGFRQTAAYNASKAFISSYMEGLRHHSVKKKLNIAVSEIRPGFIDTPMTKENKGMIWLISSEKAAEQILKAIDKRVSCVYVPKKWWWIALYLKWLPRSIYYKA